MIFSLLSYLNTTLFPPSLTGQSLSSGLAGGLLSPGGRLPLGCARAATLARLVRPVAPQKLSHVSVGTVGQLGDHGVRRLDRLGRAPVKRERG